LPKRTHHLVPWLAGILLALPALAGPVEFGMAELNRAAAARGLRASLFRFKTEVTLDAPESYSITPNLVAGGDLRGVMYGLLDASEQVRDTGRVRMVKRSPGVPIRGIRMRAADLPEASYRSAQYWTEYFQMLARNRFNRFQLVFDGNALGRASGEQGLQALRTISQTAAEYGVDFALGLAWSGDGPADAEVVAILRASPAIRTLQLGNEVTRESLVLVPRETGRRVVLDLDSRSPLLDAAKRAGVPLRVAIAYSGREFGPPWQPAEGDTYRDLLEKPRPYQVYWRVHGSVWADPQYVRRAAPTFALSGSAGFEIDAPGPKRSSADYRPWLFYLLWGRLSYDPAAPETVWMREMKLHFGAAAPDVLAASQGATAVLAELGCVQPAPDQADVLRAASRNIKQAIVKVRAAITPDNREWSAPETELESIAARALKEAQAAGDAVPSSERPKSLHTPPKTAPSGAPLTLTLRITPPGAAKAVRLRYRAVNQLAAFQTIEVQGGLGTFTIPAEDVPRRWDLMYYFEIQGPSGAVWLEPDPRAATPYFVVETQ
jgi:hypothetical protein